MIKAVNMPGLKRRKRKRVSPEPSSPASSTEEVKPVSLGPAPAKRRKVAAAQRASSEAAAAASKRPLRLK